MSEVRTVASLAMLYAFRMMGLFMVLPVLFLYGDQYEGASASTLGLALGIYGLTQALFQVPLGLCSDIVGRKTVIVGGLVLFMIGSIVAAMATSIEGLILGRALQGSGAIASAIMAMVADLTSEQNRSKAMAAIGVSIGLSFSLAMIVGPALAAFSGIQGVFWVSAGLAILGVAIVVFLVPTPKTLRLHREVMTRPALVSNTLKNADLLRLNSGIFCLHAILMASFVAVPLAIESQLQLSKDGHWKFYLPILLSAFALMLPAMLYAEKQQKIKPVFLAAVALIGLCCVALSQFERGWPVLVLGVFFFFVAFNLLESVLPSLVSKISPAGTKGTAMGIYATCQFLGAFVGGTLGGWLLHTQGLSAVFLMSASLAVVWLLIALPMSPPRHLVSICIAVTSTEQVSEVAEMAGVEEAFHAQEEGLLYLKVDKRIVDDGDLQRIMAMTA